MLVEIPLFQKCCFCLPLRCGLVAWGHFKMVLAFALLLYYSSILQKTVDIFVKEVDGIAVKEIVILSVVVVILMVDFVLQSFFIVGAIKKDVKYLKVYYFYSLSLLVLSLLLMIPTIHLMIKNMVGEYTEELGMIFALKIFAIFMNLLIQAYVLLLVRSKIIKLECVTFSRFENSAAEDDYTMRIEGPCEVK